MAKNGFGRAGRHELATALKWQKRQRKEVKQPNGRKKNVHKKDNGRRPFSES